MVLVMWEHGALLLVSLCREVLGSAVLHRIPRGFPGCTIAMSLILSARIPHFHLSIYICCYVLYLKSALASGYLPYWFPAAYEFGFHALSALQAAFCISRQHFRSRSSIGSPRRTFTYQSSMIDRYRLVHRQVSCLIGTMPYNA